MSVGDILERDEDRPAYVRFERRAVKDSEATLKTGHYVARNEDYALVTPPYSKDVVEKKVASWFDSVDQNVRSGRVPQKHFDLWKESYKRWLSGQDAPVDGTSVKDWSSISPAQCQNLINAGCRTIEDLAQANDEAMRRLGMGSNELKNKAKAWLQAAKDHGPLTEEVTQLKNQNKQLEGTISSLQEQIKRFEIRMDAQDGESINEQAILENAVKRDAFHDTPPVSEELPAYTEKERERDLAGMYFQKFGKKPHHLMKEATILKKLQE